MIYPKETAPKIIVAGTTFSNHEENSSLENATKKFKLIYSLIYKKPKMIEYYYSTYKVSYWLSTEIWGSVKVHRRQRHNLFVC